MVKERMYRSFIAKNPRSGGYPYRLRDALDEKKWESGKMDFEKYLSDYEMVTENDISKIDAQGITLKTGMYICFQECSKVWAKANSVVNIACVGDRDILNFCFTFYTLPKPITIQFIKKRKLTELFSKNNTRQRFHNFHFKIIECGYRTFDMT